MKFSDLAIGDKFMADGCLLEKRSHEGAVLLRLRSGDPPAVLHDVRIRQDAVIQPAPGEPESR